MLARRPHRLVRGHGVHASDRGCRRPRARWKDCFLAHRSISSSSSMVLLKALRERVKVSPMAPTYDPTSVEKGWQDYWQQALGSNARGGREDDTIASHKVFRMLLPPPNVTGALHLGHALTITIQDALARWHRMRGYDIRWVPGLDHAGIATQSVVERKLWKERRVSREELGRDAFVAEVWRWNEQYGGQIMHQMDHLGAIVTKDQSYFTLDEQRSEAVVQAFVTLYEKGLIYRRRRMVNWCPTLQTAISDIEVDAEEVDKATWKSVPGRDKPVEVGVMHRVKYQVEDSHEFVEVDTTRPETIFGDVALAVHPADSRYKHFHDKCVIHPFSRARLPIITDDKLVNMELGTGVVKITPAHDPKDFECAQRHGLPEVQVMDPDGNMCGNIDPRFLGMNRFDARERVVEELQHMHLYVNKLDHATTLSICSRSGDIIEPRLMPQWFVDCTRMAARAATNVRTGVLTIEPKSHEQTWFHFLDHIQDWCISRQLWWGHRVPAYRVKGVTDRDATASETWFVAASREDARHQAETHFGRTVHDDEMEQDADVLDTWFSSALLPLSAWGWPKVSASRANYPLDLLETGSDILFFWVARMAMLCEEFAGRVPFRKVLLHPMVRDKAGRKMSKSLGNVLDPLHVIHGIRLDQLVDKLQGGHVGSRERKTAEKVLKQEFPRGIPTCGADALRLTLASYLQQERQIHMDVQRVVSSRHFCNKVWNAVRYALPLLETSEDDEHDENAHAPMELAFLRDSMTLADRWILSRLAAVVSEANDGIASNQLATSVASIQKFFVQELCDLYIEFSKPVLYGNRLDDRHSIHDQRARKRSAQATLHRCLDYSLRLLHPFTPFVTEELWQRIRVADPLHAAGRDMETSILCSEYPETAHMRPWIDVEAEARMTLVIGVIHGIRSLRHTVKVLAPNAFATTDSELPTVGIVCSTPAERSELQHVQRDIQVQCRVNVAFSQTNEEEASHVLTHSVSDTCRVLLAVPDDAETKVRVAKEIARLENRIVKSVSAMDALTKRQQDAHYALKVPRAVQVQDTLRLTQLRTSLDATQKSLRALQQLQRLH